MRRDWRIRMANKKLIDHPNDSYWSYRYCVSIIKHWEHHRFIFDAYDILREKNDLLTIYQSIGGTRLDEIGFKDMFDYIMKWYHKNKIKYKDVMRIKR